MFHAVGGHTLLEALIWCDNIASGIRIKGCKPTLSFHFHKAIVPTSQVLDLAPDWLNYATLIFD